MEAWCQNAAHRLPVRNALSLLPVAHLEDELRRRADIRAISIGMSHALLTLAEAADRLRVSVRTIEREAADGRLALVRIRSRRMIDPFELARYIAAAEPLTRDVILFAALTGLRRSEILRLTPADLRGDSRRRRQPQQERRGLDGDGSNSEPTSEKNRPADTEVPAGRRSCSLRDPGASGRLLWLRRVQGCGFGPVAGTLSLRPVRLQ